LRESVIREHPKGWGEETDFTNQYFDYEFEPNANVDVSVNYSISLVDSFNGKDVTISYTDQGSPRTVFLKIPPGFDANSRIKVTGGGSRRNSKKPAGDLFVTINYLKSPGWERKAQHLYRTIDINVLVLIGGGACLVTTIDGVELEVQIRAGTATHAVIRIPGKGMPVLNNLTIRGDMFLVINPIIPSATSVESLDLLARLKTSITQEKV
jgi:DnaJ-class molecular chaperone